MVDAEVKKSSLFHRPGETSVKFLEVKCQWGRLSSNYQTWINEHCLFTLTIDKHAAVASEVTDRAAFK